jgi:hypothetical protein
MLTVNDLENALNLVRFLQNARAFQRRLRGEDSLLIELDDLHFDYVRQHDADVFSAMDASVEREIAKAEAELRAMGVEPGALAA